MAAPVLTFLLALTSWAFIPFDEGVVLADLNLGILYIFAISSLGVYGVITAGWSSNSKYAFLGALRSTAQMVSYEVSIGLIIITVLLCVGSLNLSEIVLAQKNVWFGLPLFPMLLLFFISCLAETNRAPFDVAEGESELVAGFHVEYSGMGFAIFFIAEYANMILISALTAILFFGGWLSPFNIVDLETYEINDFISSILLFFINDGIHWFIIKTLFFMFCFIWFRATFPRYRYDQIMRLGWKILIPLTLLWIFVEMIFIYYKLGPWFA